VRVEDGKKERLTEDLKYLIESLEEV